MHARKDGWKPRCIAYLVLARRPRAHGEDRSGVQCEHRRAPAARAAGTGARRHLRRARALAPAHATGACSRDGAARSSRGRSRSASTGARAARGCRAGCSRRPSPAGRRSARRRRGSGQPARSPGRLASPRPSRRSRSSVARVQMPVKPLSTSNSSFEPRRKAAPPVPSLVPNARATRRDHFPTPWGS